MSVTQFCYRNYRRVANVCLPGVRFQQYHYEDALQETLGKGSQWLDLGCGRSLLPYWRKEKEKEIRHLPSFLVGIDADLPSLRDHPSISSRVKGTIGRLPFREGSFDLATANMVVEHLADPEAQFAEVGRILRPGGHFLFITPNAIGYKTLIARAMPERIKKRLIWWLEGRKEEDVFPTFYRANTERRIRELAAKTGFDDVEVRMVQGGAIPHLVLFPPLLLLEIIWIRLLLTEALRKYRIVIVARLRKGS